MLLLLCYFLARFASPCLYRRLMLFCCLSLNEKNLWEKDALKVNFLCCCRSVLHQRAQLEKPLEMHLIKQKVGDKWRHRSGWPGCRWWLEDRDQKRCASTRREKKPESKLSTWIIICLEGTWFLNKSQSLRRAHRDRCVWVKSSRFARLCLIRNARKMSKII